jgi:uroporphyrinogen decarboxylase
MVFIDACLKKEVPYTPIWMMRQAGRYLPEYMAVREKAGDFISLCKNPKLASEVTIQPIDIIGVDAAILFSDILVVPMEMGLELKFIKGKGPLFPKPIETEDDLKRLEANIEDRLSYVYSTIELIKKDLKTTPLIGFAGAPWTLITYMIEGEGSKTYAKVKKLIYSNPTFVHKILKLVTEELKRYLERQILAGADAIQIFDSWANALESEIYFEFGFEYIKEICEYLKSKYPHIPLIVFPKGISSSLDKVNGNFDVFGVDWSTPLDVARDILSDRYTLQGNLEPARLYSKERIKDGVEKIVKIMDGKSHIFNLGHGMIPDLEPENAKYLVDLVHSLTKRG